MDKRLLLLGLFVLLLIPASAILNTKHFDTDTNTITIKDWLGLSDYETIKFTKETYSVASAEIIMNITPAQDMESKDAFGKIEFISKGGKDYADKKIKYQIQYESTEKYKVKLTNYSTCDDTYKNGTKYSYQCNPKDYEVNKERIVLVDFSDLKDLTAKQTYIIHLTAQKHANVDVDWIGTFGGLRVTEKTWWSADWLYKKKITLTEVSNNNLLGYAVPINVAKDAHLITCEEVRFTNDAQDAEYPYFWDNSNSTTCMFYVNVSSISALSITDIYMYYGNTSMASTASNGANTFLFFDGGESGTMTDVWTKTAGAGTYTYSIDISFAGTKSLEANGVSEIYPTEVTGRNMIMESWYYDNGTAVQFAYYPRNSGGGTDEGGFGIIGGISATEYITFNGAGGSWVATGTKFTTQSTASWKKYGFVFLSNQTMLGILNNTIIATRLQANNHDVVRWGINNNEDNSYWDNFRVRHYVFAEPSYSFGAEEEAASPGSTVLNAPPNNYNTTSTTITFNCTGYAQTGYDLQNITLVVYDSVGGQSSTANDTSGLSANNYTYIKERILSSDSYKWNCLACDDLNCTWAATNRTIILDALFPNVYFDAGTTAENRTIGEILLNVTASDPHFANITTRLYNSTALNYTNLTTAANVYLNYSGLMDDIYYFNATAKDTFGHSNTTATRTITIDTIKPFIKFDTGTTITNRSTGSIIVNVTASDLHYANTTIRIYNISGIYNTSLFANTNKLTIWSGMIDGTYYFNATAYDTFGNLNSTTTSEIIIDTIPPKVDLVIPANNTNITTWNAPYNVTFNFTSADAGVGLQACWYYNNSVSGVQDIYWKQNISCNVNFTLQFNGRDTNYGTGGTHPLPQHNGWYRIRYNANDSVGNTYPPEDYGNVTTFFINFVNETATYAPLVVEDAITNVISMNITATSITSLNGTLYYNNTAYFVTASNNGTYGTLVTNVPSAPIVGLTNNNSFYWNYTINTVNHLSINYSQMISTIPAIVVTDDTCGNQSRYFTFADEENRTALEGIKIDYNFVYGILNSSFKTLNGTLASVNNISICTNFSTGNYTLSFGQINYQDSGYVKRSYFFFEGTKLVANELVSGVLYDLTNAHATSFLFTFQDTQQNLYTSKYTSLLRWYPDIDEYKSVEMGRTDNKGQTIMRVLVEDAEYRVGLYHQNGSLINLASASKFACLATPCSYTMSISVGAGSSFLNKYGIDYSLKFNDTTKVFTFIWNDPSLSTDSMTLRVHKFSGGEDMYICNETKTGYTNVITCDVSAYGSGTYIADVYRSASWADSFANLVRTITDALAFRSPLGLVIAFIFVVLGALLGIFSPVGAIIMVVIGLIPAFVMHSVALPVLMGIAVLAGISIHLMKKVS